MNVMSQRVLKEDVGDGVVRSLKMFTGVDCFGFFESVRA